MRKTETPRFARELTVGEVAARSGVATSTLHFYESKGLIRSWRNAGNQRRYPRGVLRRVAIIKVAQRTGIPLAAIGEAMAALPEIARPQPLTGRSYRRGGAPILRSESTGWCDSAIS